MSKGMTMDNRTSNDDAWKSKMIIDILKAVSAQDEDRADKLFLTFASAFFQDYHKEKDRKMAEYHASGAVDHSLSQEKQ